MHHPPHVHWAYPGEDDLIPSSRGSGILFCQARALRFEPSVGPLSAPVHLCPCARQWHVAIPRRYIGAPELRLVVGELTSSRSHPFRDSRCFLYDNLQRSFCAMSISCCLSRCSLLTSYSSPSPVPLVHTGSTSGQEHNMFLPVGGATTSSVHTPQNYPSPGHLGPCPVALDLSCS